MFDFCTPIFLAYFAIMYYVRAVCPPVNDVHATATRNTVLKPGIRELGECPSAGSLKIPVQYSPTIDSDPSWQARWERLVVENMRPGDAINPLRCVVFGRLTSRGKSRTVSMPELLSSPRPHGIQRARGADLMWPGCAAPRGFTLGNALVIVGAEKGPGWVGGLALGWLNDRMPSSAAIGWGSAMTSSGRHRWPCRQSSKRGDTQLQRTTQATTSRDTQFHAGLSSGDSGNGDVIADDNEESRLADARVKTRDSPFCRNSPPTSILCNSPCSPPSFKNPPWAPLLAYQGSMPGLCLPELTTKRLFLTTRILAM